MGDMLIAEGNPILFGRRLEIIKDTDGHAHDRVRGAEVVLGPVLQVVRVSIAVTVRARQT